MWINVDNNMDIGNLYGLSVVNVELTSRCNKNCVMCGRRDRDKKYPELIKNYGDMDFQLVEKIAKQLPENIVIQFHNNGESLLYPRWGEAIKQFSNQITSVTTNGKLLLEKFDEIVDNLDTIAISVFEKDVEAEEQYKIVKEFVGKKGDRKLYLIIRQIGEVENIQRYKDLGLKITKRVLHAPEGSFNYQKDGEKIEPIIPEHGICNDFLSHLAINKDGDVSICVRFDPNRLGVLGSIKDFSLEELWNSPKRLQWLEHHKKGQRDKVPLCSICEFYGVPIRG